MSLESPPWDALARDLGIRAGEPFNLGSIALRKHPEWNEAAAKAAGLVLNLGVPKGDRILFSLPPGPELTAGLLGCLLSGVLPCVLAPGNPELLLEGIRRTGARMLVLEDSIKSKIDPHRRELPDLWHVVAVTKSKASLRMGAGDFLWEDYFLTPPSVLPPVPGSLRTPAILLPSGVILSHALALALANSPQPEEIPSTAIEICASLLGARSGRAWRDPGTGLALLLRDDAPEGSLGRPLPGLELDTRSETVRVRVGLGWPVLEPRGEWYETALRARADEEGWFWPAS